MFEIYFIVKEDLYHMSAFLYYSPSHLNVIAICDCNFFHLQFFLPQSGRKYADIIREQMWRKSPPKPENPAHSMWSTTFQTVRKIVLIFLKRYHAGSFIIPILESR